MTRPPKNEQVSFIGKNLKFLRLLYMHSPRRFGELMLYASTAAIFNTVYAAMFNFAANSTPAQPIYRWMLLGSLPFLVLFVFFQNIYYKKANFLLTDVACEMEKGMAATIRNSPLLTLEQEGTEETADFLNDTYRSLFECFKFQFLFFAKALFQAFFYSLYILALSPGVFALFAIWLALLLPYILWLGQKILRTQKALRQTRSLARRAFYDLLRGFVTLKINHKKRASALGNFERLSQAQAGHTARLVYSQKTEITQAQSLFLLFVASVAFIPPSFIPHDALKPSMSFLVFLFGPIEYFFFVLNDWQNSEIKLAQLEEFSGKLAAPQNPNNPGVSAPMAFEKNISFEKIRFSYPGSGTVNLAIENLVLPKGKIVFITGKNGGGKSTFLKLLTGLYPYSGGSIKVDGKPIRNQERQAYRELFASVFTDFHIDESVLENEGIPDDRVNYLIRLLGLEGSVYYSQGRFSEIALSSGQKKRLALLVAFLENKPVYVFDELAADQDPENRRFFYHVVLPDLKASNKTVFAVTHDDDYFSAADFLLHFEGGQVSIQQAPK